MIEIAKKSSKITILDSSKKWITFDILSGEVHLDWYDVNYPGEYEKSAILLEVKEYSDILFYNFLIDGKHLVIVTNDSFELKEEILSFFWDVDILIITWSKDAAKVFENIEAKLVVPYWEWKDLFLTTLGQHTEEVDSYKVKAEFALDATEFVNLK
jgi:hypothetical protein